MHGENPLINAQSQFEWRAILESSPQSELLRDVMFLVMGRIYALSSVRGDGDVFSRGVSERCD